MTLLRLQRSLVLACAELEQLGVLVVAVLRVIEAAFISFIFHATRMLQRGLMMVLKGFLVILLLWSAFGFAKLIDTASRRVKTFTNFDRSAGRFGVAYSELVINVSYCTGTTDEGWACNLTAKSGTTLIGENETVWFVQIR